MSGATDGPFVAVLTGEGRGAIAVVRAWGPGVAGLVDRVFRPARGRGLLATPIGVPRFGRFGADPGEEVILVATGGDPPGVEIHCHGGIAAVARTVAILEGLGFSPGLAPGAAEDALARASTLRTARILQDQADGAWDRARRALIDEANVDPASAGRTIDALLARAEVGLRLLSGWRVVLMGRPNAGKSRLMNAIAGYDRSVVSGRAGTTRDVVTARVAIDGWPVDLSDTAGLRHSTDRLESSGIALTHARVAGADLVIAVLDRSRPLGDEDREILARHPGGLAVANKSDLDPAWDEDEAGALPVSAASGAGLPALLTEVSHRLVPDPPPSGSAVPFTEGQAEDLRAMRRKLAGS